MGLNRTIQRNYLAEWTVIGPFKGTIAWLGSIVFYVLAQLMTNLILDGSAYQTELEAARAGFGPADAGLSGLEAGIP